MSLSFKKFLKGEDVTERGTFSQNDELIYKIEVPRKEGIRKLELIVNEDEYYPMFKSFSFPFIWDFAENGIEYFSLKLDLKNFPVGIYFINLKITTDREEYLYSKFCYLRQLTIYQDEEKLKPEGGIIYHIFVDRFYSSGKSKIKETSILNPDWDNGIPQYAKNPTLPLKNNMVFGGDLFGIGEKMEYIASLGTKYIYLSPIFAAYSNHKYDTGNYLQVDESLGGEEGLRYLSERAKEFGIKLILDGVFNHTGSDSLYFNRYKTYGEEGAYNSKNSPYYEWYNFKNYPNDYESWWGIETLPRVKSFNDSYIDYICGKNSVVSKWMQYDLGGWRLDVADELSDKFLKAFRKSVKEKDKDAVIIGEVWENASNKISYSERRGYFLGEELDSVMNYPIRDAIIELFKNGSSAKFLETVKIINYHYPDFVKKRLMNLLSTHDTERLITVLAGKALDNNDNELLSKTYLTEEERNLGIKKLKDAYALLYFLPGMPSVFYGDEIGMEGYHDPFCRRPFKWKETEGNELLDYFRNLGKMRLSFDVFKEGDLKIIYEKGNSFVLKRKFKDEELFFICNMDEKPLKLVFKKSLKDLINNKKLKTLNLKEKNTALLLSDFENEITVK